MNKITLKKIIINILIILIIFLIDRFSKIYILNIAKTEGEVDVYINSILHFILIWNTGVGFGLFSSEQPYVYNLITFLILVINLIIIYLIFKSQNIISYFYAFILGGSLGNLFDRMYYTAVPDFIDINYKGYHWFIFNVADIFITLGIICLIFAELLDYKKPNANK